MKSPVPSMSVYFGSQFTLQVELCFHFRILKIESEWAYKLKVAGKDSFHLVHFLNLKILRLYTLV